MATRYSYFEILFADGGDLRGQRQGEEEAEEAHGS
jgi:hypothetical protein